MGGPRLGMGGMWEVEGSSSYGPELAAGEVVVEAADGVREMAVGAGTELMGGEPDRRRR